MTGVPAPLLSASVELLDQLFVVVRQIAVRGRDTDEVREAATALRQAFVRAEPPFSIQVFADALLRDRVPLPLSLEAFRRCQQLIGACGRWGAHEIAIDEVPTVDDLIGFAEALFTATNSQRSTRAPQRRGLRLRALWRIASNPAPSEAALDAHLHGQLARAYLDVHSQLATVAGVWPWYAGCLLTFRLERCLSASVTATCRALELGPQPWTKARRSVACAVHVGAVLARMRVSPLSQRAAMHAALVLATHGLAERDGVALVDAASAALPGLLATGPERGVDPHRLRVCALVQAAAESPGVAASMPLLPLLHVAYELERKRCPADLELCLSRIDLQAWLSGALGREVHDGWGRALLGLLGLVPVGSYVLADGRLGVVMAPSDKGDPWRPRVLVGGQLVIPEQPINLHSPLARA